MTAPTTASKFPPRPRRGRLQRLPSALVTTRADWSSRGMRSRNGKLQPCSGPPIRAPYPRLPPPTRLMRSRRPRRRKQRRRKPHRPQRRLRRPSLRQPRRLKLRPRRRLRRRHDGKVASRTCLPFTGTLFPWLAVFLALRSLLRMPILQPPRWGRRLPHRAALAPRDQQRR